MSENTSSERDTIEKLAESFAARFRRGERPGIEEYAQRYPDLADELRELLPALVLLEQCAACEVVDVPTSTRTAKTPTQIGEFSIVREIGRGGMGVVYEAIQQSLGRHVALKVLSSPVLLNPTHLERFELEARAAARLHHTHIVPVFGVGEHEGIHFYAMQFIQGQSLDLVIEEIRRLRRVLKNDRTMTNTDEVTKAVADGLLTGHFRAAADGKIEAVSKLGGGPTTFDSRPPAAPTKAGSTSDSSVQSQSEFSSSQCGRAFYQSVARVGMQVADALAYAHGEGILHRDIKPSNLLLDAKGNIWITDFGLAKSENTDGITQTGDFVGTLRYMAPERLKGWSDRRSDVYSLGATLLELVTLKPFLETESHGQLVNKILHENPLPPSKFDSAIPRDLETILLKATAKEPAARYHTAADMAGDLQRFLADRPIEARRSTPVEQFVRWCRRNPLVAALAGALAVLLVAAVVILSISNARIRREAEAKEVALREKNAALTTARDAVNHMLTRTASDIFADSPRLHPLRLDLVEDALQLYQVLASASDADPTLRYEMALAFHSKAALEREMGRYPDAVVSLRRSIEIQESVLSADPSPPEYLEQLAASEQQLAFSMYFSTYPQVDSPEVIAQYQRSVDRFDDLERIWPDRPQPAVHARRYMGHFASLQGKREVAEQHWRNALARGELYCAKNPQDLNEVHEIAWACTNLYDSLTDSGRKPSVEGKAILQRGLKPLLEQLHDKPEIMSARDVMASLEVRLAFHDCAAGQVDEGLTHFRQAADAMQALCEDYPQNADFWKNLYWFHEEMGVRLRTAGRNDEAQAILRTCRDWLRDVEGRVTNDPAAIAEARDLVAKLSRLSSVSN